MTESEEFKAFTTIESPKEITKYNVMFWEPESKQLLVIKNSKGENWNQAATLLGKAEIILLRNCIQKLGDTQWNVLPIKGYNSTTYNIISVEGDFQCNCQGFKSKQKTDGFGSCSHILAVKQFEFMNNYKKKEYKRIQVNR